MAVYDCFLFCHELDLLELRLEILWDHVDQFVIGESPLTFMQDEKPLFLADNLKRFNKWRSKILHIEIPVLMLENAIAQEELQRDCLKMHIDPHASDLILLNDVDEIPNPEVFDKVQYGPPVRLSPYWSSFYLNSEVCGTQDPLPTVDGKPEWPHMRAFLGCCTFEQSFSAIRWSEPIHTIANGGWHFQNIGGPESVAFKCRSFSHAQAKSKDWEWKDPSFISKAMRNPFAPDSELSERLAPADKSRLPKYVIDNWEALKAKGMIYE